MHYMISNESKQKRIESNLHLDRMKWKRWLNKKIRDEIETLRRNHHIYGKIKSIMAQTKKIYNSNTFVRCLNNTCADSILMGIRRLVAKKSSNKTSISLHILLESIKPYSLSSTSLGVSKSQIKTDMKNLKDTSKTAVKYADKWVAHSDKDNMKVVEAVKQDIDDFGNLVRVLYYKYYKIVFNSEAEPFKEYDDQWKQIFTFPWLAE